MTNNHNETQAGREQGGAPASKTPPFGNSPMSAATGADEPSGQIQEGDTRDVLEDEFDALTGILNPQQVILLRQLGGLYLSLAGPQDLLDAAGGLNRPGFPGRVSGRPAVIYRSPPVLNPGLREASAAHGPPPAQDGHGMTSIGGA